LAAFAAFAASFEEEDRAALDSGVFEPVAAGLASLNAQPDKRMKSSNIPAVHKNRNLILETGFRYIFLRSSFYLFSNSSS
jgi:hypothetical protein